MKYHLKHLFVFLFLFAILEKAEVSVLSLITESGVSKELLGNETEGTSGKESESSKEPVLKDYWACSIAFNIPDPLLDYKQNLRTPDEQAWLLLFYPSVPTPPPDAC